MMDNTKKINHTAEEKAVDPDRMNNMDLMVGYILLIGVLLSVFLIITGTAWNWIQTHNLTTTFTITSHNYFEFLQSGIDQLFHGPIQPRLLISLGIAVLMLTPYLRVMASVIYFAFFARNLKYTIFTLFVFSVLTYSLFLR